MQTTTRQLAVTAAVLVLAMTGVACATSYVWDGNGSSDNSGNWSGLTNWSPDATSGRPNNTDDVTLPDVTSGTRTITFDGTGTGARTLTINQTTVGATNKLVLSQNMVNGQFAWGVNGLTRNLTPAGTIVIEKGSYNFQPWWGSGQASPTATLGANVTVNSTGGTMADMWDGPNTPLKFQGTVNLTTGVTTFGDGNTVTLDTGAVMNLTSGGGASVGNGGTMTIKGTVNGNSTGSLRARTLILDAGSAVPSSVANIYANNLSIRSTTPGSFDLTNSTLRRVNNATTADFEAAASGAGSNFLVNGITLGNYSGTLDTKRYRLVNTYDNSGTQAGEFFLVNSLNASGAWQEEFDLNGNKLVINGGVANYSGGDIRLSNRSAGHGVMEFRTTGGNLNLNAYVGISGGGALEVVGPATISNFGLSDMGTSVGNNGGTFKFNGNISNRSDQDTTISTANSIITIDLVSTANTFSSSRNFSVANGSTVTFNGNFSGSGADAGRGLGASGNATPALAGTIVLTGNYTSSGNGVRTIIGQNATLKVGGSFVPGATWGGAWGTFWTLDTSATPGIFVLNGGGTSTQDFEIMSNNYSVSGDTLVTSVAGSVSQVPFGTISIGEGATPASVRLVNNANNAGTDNQQVARNLIVTSGSTLNLNGYQMTVALGTATISGNVTGAAGKLRLAENASLAVTGGTVSPGQLPVNSGSAISLTNGAINAPTFTLAGGNTITSVSGSNSIQTAMTLNGAVTIDPQGGTLTISAPINGAGSLSLTPGSGTVILSHANNTYGGTTQVSSGRLHVTGTMAAGDTVTVDTAGVLSGTGAINRTVIIQNGGAIAPGASPGTLTAAAETWGPAGIYDWQLYNTTGTAGLPNGWDLLDITNALTVTATSGNPFVIRLESLSGVGPDVQGLAVNWDDHGTWAWLIASAGSITGWDVGDGLASGLFTIDTANFSGLTPGKSAFSVSKTGNEVFLNYAWVPEPMSGLLLALGAAAACLRRKAHRA